MNKGSENIAAATALGKILEIKQYGLAEDYSHLEKNYLVQEVNLIAKGRIGIDLLSAKTITEFSIVEKYEEFLDKFIDQNLINKYSDSFLIDELELISQARPFSINTFREFKIGRINSLVKLVYKKLGISPLSIISHVKNPYNVQVIDEQGNNFLVASKLEWRSKELIALFHISVSRSGELVEQPRSFDELAKQIADGAQNMSERQPHIMSVFMFRSTNQRFNSPVKMFLQAISKYGQNITIGNVTKKFFLNGTISKLLINNSSEITYHEIFGGSKNGVMQMIRTISGYQYSYVYTISVDVMVSDYKKNGFL